MRNSLNIGIVIGGLHPAVLGGKEKQALNLAIRLSKHHNVIIFTNFRGWLLYISYHSPIS